MKDIVKSSITGKLYDPSKVVRILNCLQAAAYISNGAELLDLYTSISIDKPALVFVFEKEKTVKLYDSWCKKELI